MPIGPFMKAVITTAAAVYSNWDTIVGLFDRHVENPTDPIYGYYCQHIFEMKNSSGAFTTRERGLFGMHYVNTTGGDLDVTWTAADYASVESAVQAFWTSFASSISNDYRLVEHRWYPYGPNVVPPSPPVRVTTLATPILGTSTVAMPHQLACTATFRTALRRHWGRIYLPITSWLSTPGGQGNSTAVNSVATAVRTMIMSPFTSNGIAPVVWDRQRKSALTVSALEVDSVPDVIRRRRPRETAFRAILTS
jgi:hypothetical protein